MGKMNSEVERSSATPYTAASLVSSNSIFPSASHEPAVQTCMNQLHLPVEQYLLQQKMLLQSRALITQPSFIIPTGPSTAIFDLDNTLKASANICAFAGTGSYPTPALCQYIPTMTLQQQQQQHLAQISFLAGLVNLKSVASPHLIQTTSLDVVDVTQAQPAAAKDAIDKIANTTSAKSRHKKYLPLATDEDQNWLSEFHCFVRSTLVEVYLADKQDVMERKSSKSVALGQVGIRCRFCAHLPSTDRASRSSAFPSSVSQIYQSFTMMVREHFARCPAIHSKERETFLALKGKSLQGDFNSKEYWKHSALKLGMVDGGDKIELDETAEAMIPPFGTELGQEPPNIAPPVLLVSVGDKVKIPQFLFLLLLQVQQVRLLPSERKGCRTTLRVGLPGFACRHCCKAGRFGLCRVFPANRRTLPGKVYGFLDHIHRCKLCPTETKIQLVRLLKEEKPSLKEITALHKGFFDRLWVRLGK